MGIESYNHTAGVRLAICQVVFSVLTMVCGIIQAALSPHEVNRLAIGWWLSWSFSPSLLHFAAIATGFAAARQRSRCAITANMVVNILVVILVSVPQVFIYLSFTVAIGVIQSADQIIQDVNSLHNNAVSGSVSFGNGAGEVDGDFRSGSTDMSSLVFGGYVDVYLALCITMMVLGIAQMIVTIWSSAIGCSVVCCGNTSTSTPYVHLENPVLVPQGVHVMQQPDQMAVPYFQPNYAAPQYAPATGGQFAPPTGVQYAPATGGQYMPATGGLKV